VGGEFHEAQLWEEVTEELIFTERHALNMYIWLSNRFSLRSTARALPEGMPDMVDDVTVETRMDSKAGYILFAPRDRLAAAMKNQPNQVMIEYEYGHMRVEMGEAYTVRMLANEFYALTQNTWEMYPKAGYRRLIDGTTVHNVTTDLREFHEVLAVDDLIEPPPKILEERGR
jgi:hypothetical protein